MTNSGEEQKRPRVVFLGSGKAGKTSIIKRFLKNTFEAKYHPTVEDIYSNKFEVNSHVIDLEMLDTSGSYDFPAMRRICITRAAAIVLVFAQDDLYSFQNVQQLLHEIKENREDILSIPFVIVCNKADQEPSVGVDKQTIEQWIKSQSLKGDHIAYTSAQTGQGVNEMFKKLWDQNWKFRKFYLEPLPNAFQQNAVGASNSSSTNENSVADSGGKRRLSASDILAPPDSPRSPSQLTVQEPKPPKGLFRNSKFGSSLRRAASSKRSKASSNKEVTQITKLDCTVS